MDNTLTSTSDLQTCCCNDSILTINDDGVGINIQPFLGCKITPNRQCLPIPYVDVLIRRYGTVVTPWHKYAEPFADVDERILTEESFFMCANSGFTKVNISDPGQDDVRVGDEICEKSEHDAFIAAANEAYGPLSDEQLANVELIVDAFGEYGDTDTNKLAYITATAWHESFFRPTRETDFGSTGKSEADVLPVLQHYYYTQLGYTVAERPFVTAHPVTGEYYYGRGFVQLTWYDNYEDMSDFLSDELNTEIDLLNNPDLVLNPVYAAPVMVYGMMTGAFGGGGLDNYINSGNANNPDFRGARHTVNGQDKASEIAGKAENVLNEYNRLIEAIPDEEEPDKPTDELANINPWDRKFYNMRPKEKLIAVDGATIFCPNAIAPSLPRTGPI